ncbi:hypothetical protein LSAT2_000858, partial [Lamellibrachia satsuma]
MAKMIVLHVLLNQSVLWVLLSLTMAKMIVLDVLLNQSVLWVLLSLS